MKLDIGFELTGRILPLSSLVVQVVSLVTGTHSRASKQLFRASLTGYVPIYDTLLCSMKCPNNKRGELRRVGRTAQSYVIYNCLLGHMQPELRLGMALCIN